MKTSVKIAGCLLGLFCIPIPGVTALNSTISTTDNPHMVDGVYTSVWSVIFWVLTMTCFLLSLVTIKYGRIAPEENDPIEEILARMLEGGDRPRKTL